MEKMLIWGRSASRGEEVLILGSGEYRILCIDYYSISLYGIDSSIRIGLFL